MTSIWLTGCGSSPKKPVIPETAPPRPPFAGEAGRTVVRMPEPGPNVRLLAEAKDHSSLPADRGMRSHKASSSRVRECYVQDLPLEVVAELLTELTGINLVVLQEAISHPIRVYLKDLPLDAALEGICRSNGLWFRDANGVMSIMTEQAYSDAMVFRRSEKIQAYFMRYTNAADMASLLSTVLSPSVQYSPMATQSVYGHLETTGKGAGGSGGGSRSSSGSSGGAVGSDSQLSGEERKQLLQQGIHDSEQQIFDATKALGKRLPAVITVFKKNNCIVVKSADAELLQEITGIVEAMDTPTQQVFMDVKILKIKLGDKFESFFQFAYTDKKGLYKFSILGSSTAPADSLTYVFSNDVIDARLSLYAEDNRVEMISAPFLMTADNVAVRFFVGEETPLRKDVTTKTIPIGDEGDTITTFEVEVEREELGTELNVSSFINADQTVTMNLAAKISSPNLAVSEITLINEKSGQPITFPLDGVDKNELNSVLVIPSGHTVALGGVIKKENTDYQQKAPILGDIPVLGIPFRRIEKVDERSETVILITPRVIGHPEEGSNVSERFLEKESKVRKDESVDMSGRPPANPFLNWFPEAGD